MQEHALVPKKKSLRQNLKDQSMDMISANLWGIQTENQRFEVSNKVWENEEKIVEFVTYISWVS